MSEFSGDMRIKKDANLRMLALMQTQPVGKVMVKGVHVYMFNSVRPEVDSVLVRTTDTHWLSTTVFRHEEPTLSWEVEEDVIRTARWWVVGTSEVPWHLVQ